jgi:hypothetical protein
MTYTTPLIQAEPKKNRQKKIIGYGYCYRYHIRKKFFFKQNIKNAGRSYSVVLRIIKNIFIRTRSFLGVRLDAD